MQSFMQIHQMLLVKQQNRRSGYPVNIKPQTSCHSLVMHVKSSLYLDAKLHDSVAKPCIVDWLGNRVSGCLTMHNDACSSR